MMRMRGSRSADRNEEELYRFISIDDDDDDDDDDDEKESREGYNR